MEAVGKLLDHLGYAAPLLYAAAAYGLFNWLDENLSDAAKAALASTMKFKDYGKEQVASALVEVFDRIYTFPLLNWRAFARSVLFTTVVFVIYILELAWHSGLWLCLSHRRLSHPAPARMFSSCSISSAEALAGLGAKQTKMKPNTKRSFAIC
jgi:hypothetical protein